MPFLKDKQYIFDINRGKARGMGRCRSWVEAFVGDRHEKRPEKRGKDRLVFPIQDTDLFLCLDSMIEQRTTVSIKPAELFFFYCVLLSEADQRVYRSDNEKGAQPARAICVRGARRIQAFSLPLGQMPFVWNHLPRVLLFRWTGARALHEAITDKHSMLTTEYHYFL